MYYYTCTETIKHFRVACSERVHGANEFAIHHEILRMRIYRISRRTHLLICGEYTHLKRLFEGSGRKDVIIKMEGYELDGSSSRL